MENKTEEIRKACIKANLEIVELKFGCEVVLDMYGNHTKNYILGENFNTTQAERVFQRVEMGKTVCFAEIYRTYPPDGIEYLKFGIKEIIGRPLHLEDIMLAVFETTKGKHIVGENGYLEMTDREREILEKIIRMWNLKESFENQSEPTKDFIHGLLYEK